MPMTDKDKARLAQYRREKIKRVPLDMNKEQYERLKAHAVISGVPVNRYIKEAIEARMDKEDKRRGIDGDTIVRVDDAGNVEYFRKFSVNGGDE